MVNTKQSIEAVDLINFSVLSTLLVGRKDIIRSNRIQKKHKKKVESLLVLVEYWLNTQNSM